MFRPSISEPSGAEFGDSPLLDFWAIGAGYEVKGGTSQKGNPWQRVHFRGIIEEVIASTDVYPLPTCDISIMYSAPERTPKRRPGQGTNEWETFSESLRKIYGDKEAGALDDIWGGLVSGDGSQPEKPGKKYHMKRVDTLLRVGPNDTNNQWHDEMKPAWQVVEVVGVGSSETGGTPQQNGIQEYVLGLADGKTEDAFHAAALDDAQVVSNPGLVTMLSNREFVPSMKQLGILSQDENGVLHRV